jgi:hypothetical protein
LNLNVDDLVFEGELAKLVRAKCEIAEVVRVNLESLLVVSHVNRLLPAHTVVEGTRVVLLHIVCEYCALHGLFVARRRHIRVAAVAEAQFTKVPTENSPLCNAVFLASTRCRHPVSILVLSFTNLTLESKEGKSKEDC